MNSDITLRDRAPLLFAIASLCFSCTAVGVVMGKKSHKPPEVHQVEQSKTTKF